MAKLSLMLMLGELTSYLKAESKIIYDNETMNDFKSLCSAEYGSVNMDLELVNLTVFVRNGERAPKNTRRNPWNSRMCIKCPANMCTMAPCNTEMLTVKGYHQGHLLANFIKDQYYSKFAVKKSSETKDIKTNEKKIVLYDHKPKRNFVNSFRKEEIAQSPFLTENALEFGISNLGEINRLIAMSNVLAPEYKPSIQGYFYQENKHHAFLKSIIETLPFSHLSLKKIDSLSCSKDCKDLRNSLYQGPDPKGSLPSAQFDIILSSLCTDVPIDCQKFDCDLEKMETLLLQEKLDFEDNLAKMREEITAISVDFAKMASFLYKLTESTNNINIVSVDSQSIVTLLAGLNTTNDKLIPYGSGVFIELWRNKKQEEFYSVLYNSKRMKFGLYKENFIK